MQKLFLTFLLFSMAALASAADSPKDVQALIAKGDYPAAEAALRQAVTDHPQSAKAHYVLAEVLAHEGNIGEAKTEASKAATLDPATHFTDPAKFQHFQHELDAALATPGTRPAAASRAVPGNEQPVAASEHSGMSLTTLLVIGVVVVLLAVLFFRRRQNNQNPYPDDRFAPPQNNVPPSGYGNNGYGNNGYGGGPGYPPQAPPRSGVGAAVAAGVGGLAAGALLDEAFRSHQQGEAARDVNTSGGGVAPDPSAQAYDDLRSDPIDMGNNDSSWDDSSSGDSGSLDDDQW